MDSDHNSHDTATPRAKVVEETIERLSDRVPGVDANTIKTSLAVIDFATRALSAFELHFARYELTQARFAVLMLLFNHAERAWTPGELAAAMDVSRPTMTGVTKGLERDDWIQRRAHPEDGRKVCFDMTPSGSERFEDILPDHFRRLGEAFDDIEPDTGARVRGAMSGLIVALESLSEQPESS